MINKFHMALRQFFLLAIMAMIALTATAMPSRAEREGVMAPVKPVPAEISGGVTGENNSRPVRLKIMPQQTRQADILSFAGPVVVTVLDADGNPVFGVDVFFTPSLENADCSAPDAVNKGLKFMAPDDPCLANGCPVYDRCGSGEVCHRRTDDKGRSMVYVILGGVPGADYMVTAGFTGQDGTPVTRTARFHSTDVARWVCLDDTSPGGHLVVFELFPEFGPYCGVPGDTIDLRAHLRLIIEQEKEHVITCDYGKKCPHIYGIKKFTTNLNYDEARQVSFDADVVFNHQPDQDVRTGNVYTCRHTILPGVNTIPVTFTATVSRDVTFTPCETCKITRMRKTVKGEDIITVYGVGTGFVDDQGAGISEMNVPVNENYLAEQEAGLIVQVTPAEYTPTNCTVVIYKDSEPVSRIPVDIIDGRGRAAIEPGFAFEQTAAYTAGIYVDNGIQNSWHLETPADKRLTIKPFRPDPEPCNDGPAADVVGAGPRACPAEGQPQGVAPTGEMPYDRRVLQVVSQSFIWKKHNENGCHGP